MELHIKVIADLIALIRQVGDASNLTLDPDLDSYYLMNVLIHQGPELSEVLGQARARRRQCDGQQEGDARAIREAERLSNLVEFLEKKVAESLTPGIHVQRGARAGAGGATRMPAPARSGRRVGHVLNVIARPLAEASAADYVSTLTSEHRLDLRDGAPRHPIVERAAERADREISRRFASHAGVGRARPAGGVRDRLCHHARHHGRPAARGRRRQPDRRRRSHRDERHGDAPGRDRRAGQGARQHGRAAVHAGGRGAALGHPGQHVGERDRRHRQGTAGDGQRDRRDDDGDRRHLQGDFRHLQGAGQDDDTKSPRSPNRRPRWRATGRSG